MQTVLVVEPSRVLSEVVSASSESSSFELVWAKDSSAAKSCLASHSVSAIVVNLDSNLDEELELISYIRKNRRNDQAHIIAISERTDTEAVRSAMKAGADDYMSMLVHPTELRARLSYAASSITMGILG